MDKILLLTLWRLSLVAGLVLVGARGELGETGEVSECDKQSCLRMGPVSVNSSVSEVKIYILCEARFPSASTCTIPSSTTRLIFVGNRSVKDASALRLGEGCFDWAESLEELHFNDILFLFLSRSTFRGLTNLRVLNMSFCSNVLYSDFLLALNGSTASLPKLEVLLLRTAGNLQYFGHFMLDNSMWEALAHTKLRYLDVSDTVIAQNNYFELFHYLPHLQFLNLSGIQLATSSASNEIEISDKYVSGLEILDLSRIYADKSRIQNRIFCLASSIRIQPKAYNFSTSLILKSLKTLILNNMCGDANRRNIENIKPLSILGQSVLQRVYLRNNHWPIVDIEPNLEAFSHLELIDLSQNGIEFLNDKAFSSLVGLKTFLLANNELGKMAKTRTEMFAQLFARYSNLSRLDLSHNNMESIPHELFRNNPLLVHIDLSQNRLTEITFMSGHLKALEVLNLRGNMLAILDITTQATLDNLPRTTFVQINDNTFKCSACEDYGSIEWIIESGKVLDYDHLRCRNGNENFVNVTKTIQNFLKDVCEKPLKIKITIYVTVSIATLMCATGIASAYIIVMRRKHRRQTRQRLDTITKLEDGRLEFLVFLQYSSKDEDFVQTNVYPHLDRHLHRLVPINKDVIAFGDKDFRVGKSIFDETIRCTKSSVAVVLLLTDNFVNSEYCLNEFDVAFRVGKPVILMLKGDVDMARAPPLIRDLFHTYVRVLWKCGDNGEYILTPSWENVCNAILEAG